MLSPRLLRFVFLPIMLMSFSVLTGIALIAFQQALAAGTGEAWMMAWVLAFVLGLPVLLLVLPAAGALLERGARSETIPLAGVKIPGVGQ